MLHNAISELNGKVLEARGNIQSQRSISAPGVFGYIFANLRNDVWIFLVFHTMHECAVLTRVKI